MKHLLVLCLTWLSLAAHADERILDYHADIQVLANAKMQVSATSRVHAEYGQIRHGIYRDFPTATATATVSM